MIADNIIILRPFKEEDAEEHLKGEDKDQIRWLSGGKSSLESVRNWIKKNQDYWQKGGPVFNFAIVDKVSNKLVGMVEANTDYEKIEGLENSDVNISYGIYPQFRGKGYATRAVELLTAFLKEKRINRAVIRVNPQNKKSVKVPMQSGFIRNGEIKTKKGDFLIIFTKDLLTS